MESIGLDLLLLLTLIAALAGFVDAIAGGGGLLTLPALLWAGLPPTQALATNKLQGSFGTLMASYHFCRRGELALKSMAGLIVLTFAGSALGTISVQHIDSQALAALIPVLLILVALYTLLSPRMGHVDSHQRISHALFALLIGFGIGFYDGFFGPGTGAFFAIAYVALLGFNLRRATAHAKLLNFTSNLASLLFFILAGLVMWKIGLCMALGQLFGAYVGSHMVIKKGATIVRPLLVIVTITMASKLLLEHAMT